MEIDDGIEKCTPHVGSSPVEGEKQSSSHATDGSVKRHKDKSDNDDGDEVFKRKKMNSEGDKGEGDSAELPESSNGGARGDVPCEKGDCFPKMKSNFRKRNYRKRSDPHNEEQNKGNPEEQSGSHGLPKNNSNTTENDQSHIRATPLEATSSSDDDGTDPFSKISDWIIDPLDLNPIYQEIEEYQQETLHKQLNPFCSDTSVTTDYSPSEEEKSEAEDGDEEEEEEVVNITFKKKPKHKWFATPEIVNRQFGFSSKKQGPVLFQQRMYGSLHCVQRLELMYKLEHHDGCVNSLNFNQSGTLLASGSDDLKVCIWNWPVGKLACPFDSGHKSNVFQAKFLPLTGDTHLATCARDGQVRIIELDSSGFSRGNRKIAQHRGPAHKLAIQNEVPYVFLSCGEDALVLSIDVRVPKSEKLLYVKELGKKVSLYSIHSNPYNQHEFIVCGCDKYVRLYDRRNAKTTVKRFWPLHITGKNTMPHVTCAVFNFNGTEILASYNDEDIYLFDTRLSEPSEYVHRYEGHKNNVTVKGVNFFGPKSEYIMSGSDCGNIFFWEKETEAIVNYMLGDENGVVNCLETHPQSPVLATSGLDEDVKIWVPSCEEEPCLKGLERIVLTNLKYREEGRDYSSETYDQRMFRILMNHILRKPNATFTLRSSELLASEFVLGNFDDVEGDDDDDSQMQRPTS